MANKTVDLNWPEHLQYMTGLFHSLYENNKLVDVTVACSEGSIRAHKMILSICSPFFQKIFEENPCKHPVLILRGTRLQDMERLIDFMYTGKICVLENEITGLIQTADDLEIKGLRECIEETCNITLLNDRRRSNKRGSDSNFNEALPKKISLRRRDSKADSPLKSDEWEHTNAHDQSGASQEDNVVATHGRETRFKGKKRVDVHHGSRNTRGKIPTPVKATNSSEQHDPLLKMVIRGKWLIKMLN